MQMTASETPSRQKLKLNLTTSDDDARPVFVTGNFNNWSAGNPQYQMTRIGQGKYEYYFPENMSLPTPLEYKYLKGSWDDAELDEYGNAAENRVRLRAAGSGRDQVNRWKKAGKGYEASFLPIIEVVSEQFEMPQLGKKRRVGVLLPFDYYQNPKKTYPVLYLHDGQNLFEDDAPYGTWGLDKRLSVMSEKGVGDLIVVAIDHGGAERINEFSPPTVTRTKFGESEGMQYVHFMTDTLKPYIDANYRSKSERNFTGIGGSSMGGLISIYAGLMRPDVYGKLMIFSPSLWLSPKIYFESIKFASPFDLKIYLYAGGKESENMVPSAKRLKGILERQGINGSTVQFKLSIDPRGRHNEQRWGVEFPKATKWLFFE